jgi:hypothetical protein
MFFLFVLSAPSIAWAGSAPADLKCTPLKAGSDMRIEGTVPADEDTLSLVVKSRDNSYTLDNDNADVTIIEALRDGVLTLSIRHKSKGFTATLYAIPATVKIKSPKTSRDIEATFEAKLSTLRPSRYQSDTPTYDDFVRNIKMSCIYKYAI